MAALPAGWSRLEVAGVVVPAEVRRRDHRRAVLRWLDPQGCSTGTGPGPGALPATVLGAVGDAARTAWRRRRGTSPGPRGHRRASGEIR